VRLPDGRVIEAERLSYTCLAEHWTEVSVEDGSTLRVKTVVTAVYRLDKRGPGGRPEYLVASTNVVDSESPGGLYNAES